MHLRNLELSLNAFKTIFENSQFLLSCQLQHLSCFIVSTCLYVCRVRQLNVIFTSYAMSELNWVELNCIELNWTELNWIELNWNEMKWIEMKWNGMKWIEMKWNEMNWNELKWIEMNWNEMNWNELKWIWIYFPCPESRAVGFIHLQMPSNTTALEFSQIPMPSNALKYRCHQIPMSPCRCPQTNFTLSYSITLE